MEKLFSPEQLTAIIKIAELELDKYLDTYVLNGNSSETSILKITLEKRLIIVEGNSDTGFRHLTDRHSFFSYKNYWVIGNNNELKLDNPSKFRPGMMPIVDYIKIAEAIFCEENKNITNNSRPDMFDKYTGEYKTSENESEKYHLITYKNTKIVHTLFPNKKKHNRKIKCRFGKGSVSSTYKFPEGFDDLLLPYEHPNGSIAYSILLRKNFLEQNERLIIQKHDSKGGVMLQYICGEKKLNNFERFQRNEMHDLQYGDVSELEIMINKIDDSTK